MKIAEVIEEILITYTPRLRKRTQEKHHLIFNELVTEIGHFTFEEFTLKKYMSWITAFIARRPSRKTFFDHTKHINILFRYAHSQRYFSYLSVFPKIDPAKESFWRVYTNDELMRIWAVAMRRPDMELKFVLAFENFMRRSEIHCLEWDVHVDLDNEKINLRIEDVKTGTKSKRGRTVPLSPLAVELLKKRKAESNSKFVFPSRVKGQPVRCLQKSWATLKKNAKIKGRGRFHDIRHTAVTMAAIQKNVNHVKLTRVAGMSIETFERTYLHDQVENLREVTRALKIKKVS